jgi:small subunit ribosomal protein S16
MLARWRIYGIEATAALGAMNVAALKRPRSAQPACLLVRRSLRLQIQGNIMVVIRLARGGSKKRPFYNIVVADARDRRDGRFIERVGFYNPVAAGSEQPLRVAMDRLSYWAGVGARLSPTVQRLVEQAKKAAPAA